MRAAAPLAKGWSCFERAMSPDSARMRRAPPHCRDRCTAPALRRTCSACPSLPPSHPGCVLAALHTLPPPAHSYLLGAPDTHSGLKREDRDTWAHLAPHSRRGTASMVRGRRPRPRPSPNKFHTRRVCRLVCGFHHAASKASAACLDAKPRTNIRLQALRSRSDTLVVDASSRSRLLARCRTIRAGVAFSGRHRRSARVQSPAKASRAFRLQDLASKLAGLRCSWVRESELGG